jgi:hypothetical protein
LNLGLERIAHLLTAAFDPDADLAGLLDHLVVHPISTPTRRGPPGCRARAASGHAAAPPSPAMKSRLRIVDPLLAVFGRA